MPSSLGIIASYNQIQCEWICNSGGNWLRNYNNENICSSSSPLANPTFNWTQSITSGPSSPNEGGNGWFDTADWNYMYISGNQWSYSYRSLWYYVVFTPPSIYPQFRFS